MQGIVDYHDKANVFNHVIISTGASIYSEIINAVDKTRDTQAVTVLHCVSTYPCPPEKANLKRINLLKSIFLLNGPISVGYSGHCEGIIDAIASLYMTPTIIEKHFTIDHSLPGRDNKFAILPQEMKILRNYVDNVSDMMKEAPDVIDFQECEKEMRDTYRGRWDA